MIPSLLFLTVVSLLQGFPHLAAAQTDMALGAVSGEGAGGLAAQAPPAAGWVDLGGAGGTIGIAPDWSSSRTMFSANAAGGLDRTTDGGRTWTTSQLPTSVVQYGGFIFAETNGRWTTVFLTGRRDGQGFLLRSTDRGKTWQELSIAGPSSLEVSPEFVDDTLAFAVTNHMAQVSHDAGNSWSLVSGLADTSVRGFLFAPSFRVDQTIWAMVGGGRASDGDLDILLSQDGGETWLSSAAGLGVRTLAVSPTYATDGTLFAVTAAPALTIEQVRELGALSAPDAIGKGWCPPESQGKNTTLVRSTDRGASWDSVQRLTLGCLTRARIVLSPRFAVDRMGFVTVEATGGTPASGVCVLYRLAAADLQRLRDSGSYGACSGLQVQPGPGGLAVALFIGAGADGRGRPLSFSSDGGVSWLTLDVPTEQRGQRNLALSPAYIQDQGLFVATSSIWRYGVLVPTLSPTDRR